MVTAAAAGVASAAEQRTILHDVSWATYESLLADHAGRSSPRFAYDRGRLEIVSPLLEHEEPSRTLATIVQIVAEEMGIEYRDTGSTTFRRRDLAQGFEPDSSFYIRNEARVRGLKSINLDSNPPPDLVIEIDVTRLSLARFPIYAGFGVPEVWRCRDGRVGIWTLGAGTYIERANSEALPLLTGEVLTHWLAECNRLTRMAWVRSVRTWVREHMEATRSR